jgi:hypothetical protein
MSGTYYLILVSDSAKTIPEKIWTNNVQTIIGVNGRATPLQVTLTAPSDLIVTSFIAPASVITGQQFKVKWTVKNNGTGITNSDTWLDQVYLSTNQVNLDYLLGSRVRTGVLSVSSTYSDSLTITIPNTIVGNYYIVVKTDYRNAVFENLSESNNTAFANTLVTQPLPVDLMVSEVTQTTSCLIGDSVQLKWKVSNIGLNLFENSNVINGLYLSADSTWSSDDKLLANAAYGYYLPQNSSKIDSMKIRLTGVKEGSYFGVVRADQNNNVIESTKTNNTGISIAKLNVSFNSLRLSQQITTTLIKNKELYYKIVIPDSLAGQTLLLSLYADSLYTPNEIYIRYGDVPTRSLFDVQYDNPGFGNQSILIQSVTPGTYYIMAYNDRATFNQTVKLLARIIKFSVLSVQSSEGGNNGNVTIKIKGAKFEPNMTATLYNSTLGSIASSNINYINSSTIYATFGLNGKSLGMYDMRLKKTTNDTANMSSAFRIVAGIAGNGQTGQTNNSGFYCTINNISTENSLNTSADYPSTIRITTAFAIQINFGNNGNVDIPIPNRILVSENGAPLSFSPISNIYNNTSSELYLEFREINGPANVLRPGSTGSIVVYSHGKRITSGQSDFIFKLIQ